MKLGGYAALMSSMLGSACLSGCVFNDVSDCNYPLRIHLQYTLNRESRDLLDEEVENFYIAAYDVATGRIAFSGSFTHEDLDAANCREMLLPKGVYNVVVWGGINSRYTVDFADNQFGHKVSISTDGMNNVAHFREHLWHGFAGSLPIDGNLTPVYDIDLRKLSNDLSVNVSFEGGNHNAGEITSYVKASNGIYSVGGNIHPDAPLLCYLPGRWTRAGAENYLTHAFTLGLLEVGDDSMLDVGCGSETLFHGSLSNLLIQVPGVDLAVDDEFEVNFKVSRSANSSIDVSIEVNQWKIMDYNISLQ